MPGIQNREIENDSAQWKNIYRLGGVMTVIALGGILLDVIMGFVTGGDLTTLPQTATGRFDQLQNSPWLGLYNLDLLNIINQLILIPAYFALYGIHRKINQPYALLSLLVFLAGTVIFVTTNTALPMLELSKKYAAAGEAMKPLFASAGEAMLARGEHGRTSVFIGFALPNIAGIMMSIVMLRGKIFSRFNAYLGIAGSGLILLYLFLVTFFPEIKTMATMFAAPGGLLAMAWMILFSIQLFKAGRQVS